MLVMLVLIVLGVLHFCSVSLLLPSYLCFFSGGGGCCCFLSLLCLVFFSVCVSLMLSLSPSPFLYITLSISPSTLSPYSLSLLCHTQVSNLFAKDELDEITQELISVMKKEFPRRPPTNDNLYDYFISRACKNLHIVLCFSPVSMTRSSHSFFIWSPNKFHLLCCSWCSSIIFSLIDKWNLSTKATLGKTKVFFY